MISKPLTSYLDSEYFDEEKIGPAFAIYNFLDGAFPTPDYVPSDQWLEVAKPSPYGLDLLSCLNSNASSVDNVLALLIVFFHDDFLIDIRSFNPQLAIELLSNDIKRRRLILPNRFGRELYDRYYDGFEFARREHLEAVDADRLLSESEQGVYQVGNLVAGPLGIIRSETERLVYPTLHLPLWHCEDTGCGALHGVELVRHEIPAYDLAAGLQALLSDRDEVPGWFWSVGMLERRNQDRRGRRFQDLPGLVSDGLPGIERSAFLTYVLRGQFGKRVRQSLRSHDKALSDGSPEAVAARLTSQSQLQTLLVLDDNSLVYSLDKAVRERIIKLPATEVRRPNIALRTLSAFDETSELSSLGVRSVKEAPINYLSSLIWKSYVNSDMLDDLE